MVGEGASLTHPSGQLWGCEGPVAACTETCVCAAVCGSGDGGGGASLRHRLLHVHGLLHVHRLLWTCRISQPGIQSLIHVRLTDSNAKP